MVRPIHTVDSHSLPLVHAAAETLSLSWVVDSSDLSLSWLVDSRDVVVVLVGGL